MSNRDLGLAVDVSTAKLSIAIFSKRGVLLERVYSDNHTEALSSLVRDALDELSLEPKDLSRLLCGFGPGSFTGIRSSLSFLSGFSLGSAAKLYGVCNMLTPLNLSLATGTYLCLLEANREEYFASVYSLEENHHGYFSLKVVKPVRAIKKNSLEQFLSSLSSELESEVKEARLSGSENNASLLVNCFLKFSEYLSSEQSIIQLNALELIEPLYVKPVSAMTLEERALSAK